MNFAPFSFLSQQGGAFVPTSISDLQIWLDFSNASTFITSSGGPAYNDHKIITAISSSIVSSSVSLNNTFQRVNASNSYYVVSQSLSNPSLTTGMVYQRPTTYRNSGYDLVVNSSSLDYVTNGPKTNTTSYPTSTEFYVFNRGTISTAGYLAARFSGGQDRGVVYQLNTGTPQKDIISYDANSPAYLYYQTTGSANVILTRENNDTTATIYNGSLQVASGSKNDTQSIDRRTFQNLGIYGSPTGTGDTTPINTHYCEVLIYNRTLSSTEKSQVWNYLSSKWNISLT